MLIAGWRGGAVSSRYDQQVRYGYDAVFPGFYSESAGESDYGEGRLVFFIFFVRTWWKGVFAGVFAKLWCFNVVFLWLVCGECAVKDGALTVAFHCRKFSSIFNFIFDQ
jgi:hypothetical protein